MDINIKAQNPNIQSSAQHAQLTSSKKQKSLFIERSGTSSINICRARSFSYPYFGTFIKDGHFDSFLKRHQIRIEESQDVQIQKNIEIQRECNIQTKQKLQIKGENDNQAIQHTIKPQENIEIRLQKSSCQNVVLTNSQFKNCLSSSQKLKNSKQNIMKESHLSQKEKSKERSEKAFSSCYESMYDQKSRLLKQQPNVITLSTLQQQEQNPQNAALPLVQDLGHQVMIYVDRNKNKQEQKQREPNIFKRMKLFTSQKVKFSEIVEMRNFNKIPMGNVLEGHDISIRQQYKLHDENQQQKIQNNLPEEKNSSENPSNFELSLQSNVPNSKSGVYDLVVNSDPSQKPPTTNKQSEKVVQNQDVDVHFPDLKLPDNIEQYSSCYKCQTQRNTIQQFWQRLRYHTRKQIQFHTIIKSLKIQNNNLQSCLNNKSKWLSDKEDKITEMQKEMNENRIERDNEIALLNQQFSKRRTDAINTHEKLTQQIMKVQAILQDSNNHKIINNMKENHLNDIDKYKKEQEILKKEIQLQNKKRVILFKQLQGVYRKTEEALQGYKQKVQFQERQITLLRHQVSQLKILNEYYFCQIQKQKDEFYHFKTKTFEKEKAHISIQKKLRNEIKIKSQKIKQLEILLQ